MKQLRTLITAIVFAAVSTALAQPANDNFANRFTLTGLLAITNGTTVAATQEAGEPDITFNGFNDGNQTAWYEWLAPATVQTTMRAGGGNNQRALIGAYIGAAVNGLTTVATAQAPNGQTNATINFGAVAGTSYKIKVDRRNTATAGTFSLVVSQQVAGPLVSLTSPGNNQVFTNPVNVTLNATVSTPLGGTVTNVSFYYQGTNLIASFTTSPYTFVWNNPPPGTYPVVARATDDSGRIGSSANANITVRPAGYFSVQLIGFDTNNVWKYGPAGDLFGTGWETVGYDDSAWLEGPAGLGVDTAGNGVPIRTTTGYSGNSEAQFFRRHFNLPFDSTNGLALTLREVVEDAAVYYINGQEVRRSPLAPAGDPLTAASRATAAQQDPTPIMGPYTFPISNLVTGDNVIAVVVLQTGGASTDCELAVELVAEGAGTPPVVNITSPANNASFFAPASIAINATASDPDGSVTNVEFFADGVKLGQDTAAPYSFVWNSPSLGAHVLRVTATDNGGVSGSAQISIVVYDALGTPQVQISNPSNNSSFAAPADIAISAIANAPNGVTNVEFYASTGGAVPGTRIGQDTTAPYTFAWNSVLAANYGLRAVVFSSSGVRATSSVVNVTITNTPPPTVVSQNPPPGTIQTLTSVQVTFSKAVTGVDAADFLINGTPASGVTPSSSSVYTFTFPQPPFGAANITWAGGHGIQDLAGQPFNAAGPGATWSYIIADTTAPTIATRTPAAGATVTNLTQINVTFSENVNGVNAGDMLINGTPATGLTANSGSDYTFSFGQPPPGPVNITWIAGHGIADTSPSANAFNSTGPGATWSYTFAIPTTIIAPSNTLWRFIPGLAEASSPDITAWRQLTFNDSSWTDAPSPFYYGDPYGAGTVLSDMQGNYQCIYLRFPFVLTSPSSVSNFIYRHQIDDGLVAWINGTEVLRVNIDPGITDPPFQSGGIQNANEPNNNGAPTIFVTNTLGLASLVVGTNILAVQAFNANLANSTDFGFNLQVEATVVNVDPSNTPPRIASVSPGAGDIFSFTTLIVRFNEPVTGVNAADLLINGAPATSVSGTTSNYTFTFPQPPYGPVAVTWAAGHGIVDFDSPPRPFNATAPGSTFNYTLINPSAPSVTAQTPLAASTVTALAQVQVTFSEVVQGVNAADLLVNGAPATGLSGSGASYTFTFPQPAYGNVAISWAVGHNIRDVEAAQNAFDTTRPGATWQYTLVDQTPPTIFAKNPPAGANVTNLQLLTVTFSENVQGVNASDLLINGIPALNMGGSGSNYTFVFARPNTSIVNINWAGNHGISDLAAIPNAFDANGPGATWQYFTPDSVPPVTSSISPAPASTVRSLSQIVVTFAEPVTGVSADDLLINGSPVQNVSGSASGPYTFQFTQPPTGAVQIAWAPAQNITDLANPPNPFAGGSWTYTLNPNAAFADKLVINEIFFHPSTERTNEEWIELHNTDTTPINLSGWRITKGVDFTFPNVSIAAGGYLVVAANPLAFQAKYPGVNNVVGGWAGQLSNGGEDIEIETAFGEVVDVVEYASEGDWAIRQRGPLDQGSRGWEWFSAADGTNFNTATTGGGLQGGRSLELRNPALPNDFGQNWSPSSVSNGTPGVVNSMLSTNIPPMVLDVTHFPAVPTSTDSVTITARIRDEQSSGVSVTLFQRNHTTTTPPAFVSSTMFDDGAHNDGLANDGVFGVTLPAQPNGTIVEFYVQAIDSGLRTNTWPAAARQVDGSFAQTANALYQVDNETTVPSAPNQPFYRIILTASERQEYGALNQNSDAEMNATFISVDGEGTKVRYLCGMRIRGAGSRGANPKNNRVNIPNDNRWNGVSEINLNSQYTHAQTMGSALALKSGLPAAYARPVQYRINGVNLANAGSPQYGSYVFVEALNGDWAAEHYPNDDGGNVYRGSRFPWTANLDFRGTNAQTYINEGYSKTSNQSENDWRDLFALTFALNTNGNDAVYEQAVRANANVTNFMRFFAVGTLMSYQETSIFRGVGDDYAMYRGVIDPRFTLVPHDFDTILNQGDTSGSVNESIFQVILNPESSDPTQRANFLQRFMRHPAFVAVYFAELDRLGKSVFAPTNLNPLVDQLLSDWAASTTMPAIKTFNANRVASVLAQIPRTNSVFHTLALSNGVPRSTAATMTLRGTVNAIDTRVVRVNGAASAYSAWEGRWTNNAVTLQPGLNNLLVEAVGATGQIVWSSNLVVWFDTGSFNNQSGSLAGNTVWAAGAGPFRVTGNITIPSGVTLTIQPGATVYFNAGVGLTVASGGRLLAEGNANARIQFNSAPGPSNRWSGIVINGAAGSPESRITYAHIAGNNSTAIDVNGGDAFLDHLTFGSPDRRYMDLDGASFVVSHCVFPNATAGFEAIHGTGGIRSGGRGIFVRNFFGRVVGYNDTIDFSGGNRPGPIVQFIDNVFMGSDDDLLDLDSTDAWVEGNIFLHTHRSGSPDSAGAVSGGNDDGQTSDITMIGNIFYDVDHAATAKQGNFYTFVNNTVVRQSSAGFEDAGLGAVLNFADEGTVLAAGIYSEGNIIVDAERLTRHLTNGTPLANNTTFNNNLMPFAWAGPGTNNSTANPLLNYLPQLSETSFASWEQAQVMRDWFSLQPASPGRGTGPNGIDKGGVVPLGVSISGEPGGTSSANPHPLNSATLRVGVNRTGNGIPAGAAAFPSGSGYTHYRWRLDGNVWSAETPTATPITLNNLGLGAHQVEVAGKRDAGLYQDDTNYASAALITASRTWFVNTNTSVVRINEILASNNGVFVHSNTTPDAVELYNASATPVNLEGMRLTDDPADPDKFIFPPGSTIPAGGYLVVFADTENTAGIHLDYTLSAEGEALYLYDSVLRGGALLDSITFGLQLQNLSVGRLADGSWNLCQPTMGSANIAAATGDPLRLKINEWLASGLSLSPNDFIELFNQDPLPIALGGLFLTDEPTGWPNQHEIASLSFIAGGGYRSFVADADADDGADHLNFTLTPEQGMIGLMNRDLSVIDCVVYGPQRVDISQGRSPNGSSNIVFFAQPTPGAPNQSTLNTNTGVVINEVFANNRSFAETDGTTPDWIEFHNLSGSPVDISDMSFTDSTLTPRRYVFAPGTVIGALGYLRLRCNPDLPVSTTNAGFGISATGGGAFLFDKLANGGGLINAVSYGLQAVDFAIGRVPNGTGSFVLTVPTPNAQNSAAALGNVSLLKINEWMASPESGEDDWFEIYNPNVQPVSVGGLFLSDTLANRTKSPIPALSFIGGGTNGWQQFWADSNPGAGADHVNFALGAGGEALALSTSGSSSIDSLTFPAQQEGVSEGRFPDGSATIVRFPQTPSPGDANYLLLPNIVINEALTHTDLPFEDAIEVRNLSGVETNIGNWWLSDARGALKKYRIPANTTIPANGFVVFYEYQFNFDTNDPSAFSLSSDNGDQIYLSAAEANGNLTGYRAEVEFGASENGVSFGRYVTSDNRAEFVAMSARSLGQNDPPNVGVFRTGTGQANPYPKVGPVVIAQIMYRPPDIGTNDNTLDEFIELRNMSGSPVNLYDLSATTNTWRLRDAVDFDFPAGVSLPAGGRLLVVSFDPLASPGQLALFRAAYGVDATVPVYGPYIGRLANGDENIELYKPDPPNNNDVPYVLVEQVHYFDTAPWPTAADGTGAALQRISLTGFGNDPTNWVAAVPNFGGGGDTDGDGMPDTWEIQYGLNPNNPFDANFDLDGDGSTNRQEYIAGTDPTQAGSALRIISVENIGVNSARLTFLAVSNRTYGLEFKNALTDPSWTPLLNIGAASTNRTMLINTTVPGTNRFYRVRTP